MKKSIFSLFSSICKLKTTQTLIAIYNNNVRAIQKKTRRLNGLSEKLTKFCCRCYCYEYT